MQELNKSYNHITFQHLVNIKTNNHSIGQILTQNQSVMKLSFKLRLGYAMKMYNSVSLCSHLLMLAFLFGTSLPEQGSEYKQCTQSVSLMSWYNQSPYTNHQATSLQKKKWKRTKYGPEMRISLSGTWLLPSMLLVLKTAVGPTNSTTFIYHLFLPNNRSINSQKGTKWFFRLVSRDMNSFCIGCTEGDCRKYGPTPQWRATLYRGWKRLQRSHQRSRSLVPCHNHSSHHIHEQNQLVQLSPWIDHQM